MPFAVERSFEVVRELSQTPSLGRTENGDILLLYSNYCDCMDGNRQWLRRSSDDGCTWSEPGHEIASTLPRGGVEGTLSCFDDLAFAVYLEGSDLKRRPKNPHATKMVRSADGGVTWSAPVVLAAEAESGMPFGHIIRLRASGRFLLPMWAFDGFLERSSSGSRVLVLCSDDGRTWRRLGTIPIDPSVRYSQVTETSLLELPDGRLLAIMRNDTYRLEAFPYGLRSISENGGASWSPATCINVNLCEPRLVLTSDRQVLLLSRSWPGNFFVRYRPLEPHEREPGSQQTETVSAEFRDEFYSDVRDFGVVLFSTEDEGATWTPELTLENPRPRVDTSSDDALRQHRYQAAYPDVLELEPGRLFCVFRQPDPAMPDVRPGLTYSHVFQRFVAGNIVSIT